MYENITCTVKPETIAKVIRYISATSCTTRKEIAENCGISLMTSGKAVEFLLDESLVIERRTPKKNCGPRPMGIRLNPKYNSISIDLYDRNFTASLLDITGKELSAFSHTYNRNIFIDDNLRRFLRNVETNTVRNHPEYRIGVGILIPDEYSAIQSFDSTSEMRERCIASVKSIIDKRLFPRRFIFDSKGKLALDYFSSFPEYRDNCTLIYICLNECSAISEVMIDGKRVAGIHGRGSDIMKMYGSKNIYIAHLIRHSNSGDELCDTVALAVANLIACFDPHVIVIDSEFYIYKQGIADLIKLSLEKNYGFAEDKLPRFIVPKRNEPTYFARGMSVRFKQMFIDDVVAQILG